MDVNIQAIYTSDLDGGEQQASRCGRFTLGTRWGWAPQPVWMWWC